MLGQQNFLRKLLKGKGGREEKGMEGRGRERGSVLSTTLAGGFHNTGVVLGSESKMQRFQS